MSNNTNNQWKSEEKRAARKARLEELKTSDGGKKKVGKGFSAKKLLAIVIALAVLAGILALVFINNGWRERTATAATVNEKYKVTPLEANYIMGNSFYNMTQLPAFAPEAKGVLTSAFPGPGGMKPLRDTILESFEKQIKENYALYDKAVEAGIELTDEEKGFFDAFKAQIENSAAQQQMTANDLLQVFFGKGASFKTLKPIMERQLLAARYQADQMENYEFSEAEIEAKYEENKNASDYVAFHIFGFNNAAPDRVEEEEPEDDKDVDVNEDDEQDVEAEVDDGEKVKDKDDKGENDADEKEADEKEADEDEKAEDAENEETEGPEIPENETEEERNARLSEEALKKAQTMAEAIKTEEDFYEEALAYSTPEQVEMLETNKDATLVRKGKFAELPAPVSKWLFDETRKEGDTTVITLEGIHSVLYFIERNKDEDRTFDSRHILVSAEDGEEVDEAALKAKAEKIIEEYRAGEQTEEAFAALAEKYSADPGSKNKGGLYEGVAPGQFVPEYESWCLEADRQEGDIGMVFVDNPGYSGYHIIYFKRLGDPIWITTIKQTLSLEKAQSDINDLVENISYEEDESGMSLVLPYNQEEMNSVRESIDELTEQ